MLPSIAKRISSEYDAVCYGTYSEESNPFENGLDFYDSLEYDSRELENVEEFLDVLTEEIIFDDFLGSNDPGGYYEYILGEDEGLSAVS